MDRAGLKPGLGQPGLCSALVYTQSVIYFNGNIINISINGSAVIYYGNYIISFIHFINDIKGNRNIINYNNIIHVHIVHYELQCFRFPDGFRSNKAIV